MPDDAQDRSEVARWKVCFSKSGRGWSGSAISARLVGRQNGLLAHVPDRADKQGGQHKDGHAEAADDEQARTG